MMNFTDHLKEFICTFDASLDPDLWAKLVEEETRELHDALLEENREHVLKEAADLSYVVTGLLGTAESAGTYGLLSDARVTRYQELISKADNKISAALAIFGPDTITEAVKRVHESNMTKLGEDGKAIRRDDGKILKGPNYKEPDLSDLV